MLQEIDFGPGVYVDDSALAAKGKYVAANQMRFVRGKAETRYGNEKFSTTQLRGFARGIHAWADRATNRYLAVGTDQRLYASDQDGVVYDITPVVSYGTLTNPFSTTNTSTLITVSHAAHGLLSNALISFPYLVGTINGASITNATRYIITIVDANSYTFNADTAATSGGAATNGTVDYRYGLNPGNADGIGGAGFGTGSYGSSGYDTAGSGLVLYPRTWSFAYWGQNLLGNPRGQAIFEWAPNLTATELVTNSTFSTGAGGWTATASSWSIGGGNLNGSATSANVTQTVSLNIGAWHLLHIVATVTSGSFNFNVGTTTIQSCTTTNRYNQPFFNGGTTTQTLTIQGVVFTGNITQASVQVLTTAQKVQPGAPSSATFIFTTAERIVVALGCNDDSGNFDPMLARWSDQQNNQIWTATPANLAGSYPLTNGSRIVAGIAANGENLVFTDTSFYAMRFVPDPNVVYDFVELGPGTGLLGSNALCTVNGVVYWKAPNGQDYYYNGGPPTPITSNTMRHDFNNNLAWVQQDKVFTAPIGAWNEIQHIYPDLRDGLGMTGGIECSRYNKYNFAEDCWDPGLTSFTCWLDQGIFQFPIAVDTSGYIRYCEKGNSVDGGPFAWYITSAKVRQEQGYKNMTINGMQLDAAALQGGYQVSMLATWKDIRGIHTKTFGPYNANQMSGSVPVHAKGQYLQITWGASTAAPTFWRSGADLFDIANSGDQR